MLSPPTLFLCLSVFRLLGCGSLLLTVTYSPSEKTLALSGNALRFEEEINAVDVNEKRTFAAVADDTGCVTMIDLKTSKLHRVSCCDANLNQPVSSHLMPSLLW